MEFPAALVGPVDGFIEFVYSFGPLAEKTLILGELMREKLFGLSPPMLIPRSEFLTIDLLVLEFQPNSS